MCLRIGYLWCYHMFFLHTGFVGHKEYVRIDIFGYPCANLVYHKFFYLYIIYVSTSHFSNCVTYSKRLFEKFRHSQKLYYLTGNGPITNFWIIETLLYFNTVFQWTIQTYVALLILCCTFISFTAPQ